MERAISTIPANEIWRPVRDFEGLYEVSNLGRVRSVDRWSKYKGSDTIQAYRKGRLLRQFKTKCGYYLVSLSRDGGTRHYSVHRLVAEAFIPNPDNLPEVNHKDENKFNNCADNLEWCTNIYNIHYGTRIYRSLTKQHFKPVEQLTLDGRHIEYYQGVSDASRHVGANRCNISRACKGRYKTSYGYRWRYI